MNEKFFNELKEKFNATFQGTRTPRINKIDDDRKNLVKQFIEDYSIEAIDTLLQKVRESTELMKHRRNGNCPFGWIFVPRNYNDIMQGNYDDFQPDTSSVPSPVPSVAVQQQPEDKQVRWNAQRDRWLGIINLVKKNPNSSAKGQLYTAYQHGVLKKYNIDWEPPAENALAAIASTNEERLRVVDGTSGMDEEGAVPSVAVQSSVPSSVPSVAVSQQPSINQLEYVKNILKRN